MDADHEDHARQTENIEGPRLQGEERAQQAIELARIGPEQNDVGKRRQVRWRDVGERHQGVHQAAQGHIAAGRSPGQRHAEQNAQDAGAERQFKGVEQSREILRSREGACKMFKPEPLRQAEGAQQEPKQGIADQHEQHGDRQAQHQRLRAEEGSRLGRRPCCGRRATRRRERQPACALPFS